MARMFPQDIEDYEDATEGEKKVFRFIGEAAKPDKKIRESTKQSFSFHLQSIPGQ